MILKNIDESNPSQANKTHEDLYRVPPPFGMHTESRESVWDPTLLGQWPYHGLVPLRIRA